MTQISIAFNLRRGALLGIFLCLIAVPLSAQLGPVPGAQPQITYRGKLRKLDGRSVVLKLDDGRILSINRSGKTKLYRESKQIKAAAFGAGDRISVDATEDQWGFLFALGITLEKAATPEERAQAAAELSERPPAAAPSSSAQSKSAGDNEGRPTLKRKETPENAAPERADAAPGNSTPEQSAGTPAASSQTPPSQPQYDETPPALKRRSASEDQPSQSSPENAGAKPASPAIPSRVKRSDYSRTDDALIEKAREATFAFSDKLPNFLCEEYMARYARYSNLGGWEPLDIVSAEIIYENGQETYRNLKINDRPTDKKMEELSGAWSTGEFASTLNDLFHPKTDARFRDGGESNLPGLRARVYDFDVEQENSHWVVQSGSQSLAPAYKGSVWIDTDTARVLRVEIQARNLPSDFPMDVVESAVDYSWVRIAGGSVLMPVHAESLGCQRGARSCNRNIIDFRNYRKYTADSKITFGEEGEK